METLDNQYGGDVICDCHCVTSGTKKQQRNTSAPFGALPAKAFQLARKTLKLKTKFSHKLISKTMHEALQFKTNLHVKLPQSQQVTHVLCFCETKIRRLDLITSTIKTLHLRCLCQIWIFNYLTVKFYLVYTYLFH